MSSLSPGSAKHFGSLQPLHTAVRPQPAFISVSFWKNPSNSSTQVQMSRSTTFWPHIQHHSYGDNELDDVYINILPEIFEINSRVCQVATGIWGFTPGGQSFASRSSIHSYGVPISSPLMMDPTSSVVAETTLWLRWGGLMWVATALHSATCGNAYCCNALSVNLTHWQVSFIRSSNDNGTMVKPRLYADSTPRL